MRIKKLDQNLANQIAAGEVVERPASVVKELFENSIDSGATHITIDISQGGHEMIRITDNGCGIHADDLWLAVQRHSTSKISEPSDLSAIQTLGFRGEALSSIAAVSRFKLISHPADAETAFYIQTEGGDSSETVTPIAHPVGTSLEIKDLFFNTPARRKFLRTPRTEFSQIESTVHRLALCYFDVGIKLIHNQKTILDLPQASTIKLKEKRLAKLLGNDFMKEAIAIDFSAAGMTLFGWIALPTFSRSQADMQYFYLNGRYVRDKVLSHAVRSAYQDILYNGRYPAFVLYFECDPSTVDVNVHPQKQEVRLRDSRLVHDFIARGVKDSLEQVKPAQEIESIRVPAPPQIQEQAPMAYGSESPTNSASTKSSSTSYDPQTAIAPSTKIASPKNYEAFKEEKTEASSDATEVVLKAPETPASSFLLGYAIAQLHGIYILAQTEKGLVLVDQHAAHERILYEKIKQQLEGQGIQRQALLVPISISLSPQEMNTWEECQSLFDKIGVKTEAAGPGSIVVREMPVLLKGAAVDQLIKDVLADLHEQDTSQRIEDQMNSILGNMACRSAIKANHKLSIPEMNAILRDMENTANSGFCNHGRPTWLQWSLSELDKFFLRGQ